MPVLDGGKNEAEAGVDIIENAATHLVHFPLVTPSPTFSSVLLLLPE